MTSGARLLTDYAARATQYARDVVDKRILASKLVRLACKRHLDDLVRSDYRWHFDAHKANRVCAFAEKLRHEKGVLQGLRIILHESQIFLLASIFGWVDSDGVRKYRQAIVMLPRGSGKSPLAAIIALWMDFFDGEKGAEVYCGANSARQSQEVFRPAKAMVEQESDLTGRFGITVAAQSIFQKLTRSWFQFVVRKPGDGASIYCGILDELHESKDPTLLDTFLTGLNKRVGSLLLAISTAGVASLENPCLDLQHQGEQMLEGVIDNDLPFALIHCADPDIDWTSVLAVEMPNPLLGIANDREAILLAQRDAVRNPFKANIFKTKHLNLWSSASSAWMNMPAWAACYDPALTWDTVKNLPGVLGSDLASKLDLASIVTLFHDDSRGSKPHYLVFCKAYTPQSRVNDPALPHYKRWVAQGHLTQTDGSSIDYSVIESDAIDYLSRSQITGLAYDPRYADQWSQQVSALSGITRVEVPPPRLC